MMANFILSRETKENIKFPWLRIDLFHPRGAETGAGGGGIIVHGCSEELSVFWHPNEHAPMVNLRFMIG